MSPVSALETGTRGVVGTKREKRDGLVSFARDRVSSGDVFLKDPCV